MVALLFILTMMGMIPNHASGWFIGVGVVMIGFFAFKKWESRQAAATSAHSPAAAPAAPGGAHGVTHTATDTVKAYWPPILGGLVVLCGVIAWMFMTGGEILFFDPLDMAGGLLKILGFLVVVSYITFIVGKIIGSPSTVWTAKWAGLILLGLLLAAGLMRPVIQPLTEGKGLSSLTEIIPSSARSLGSLGSQSAVSPCQEETPCSPVLLADGTTAPVDFPKRQGASICFEPSFWNNLPNLGYTTSYKGGPEETYACTKDQVLDGTCSMRTGDRFRFKPKSGTPLPKYWFRTDRGNQC